MQITAFIFLLFFLLIPSRAFAVDFTVYVGSVSPFTIVSGKGQVTGAAVDVVDEIMQRAGSPIDVSAIKSISWARAVEDTETTYGTMLFCVARTPQREEKFKWVGPIAELNLGLVAKRNPRIEILRDTDLKFYRIGVVRNSAPMQILEQKYQIPSFNITKLAADELQFKMLKEGRVDLITQADTAAPAWLAKLGMEQDEYEMVYVIKRLQLYIAFNKDTADTLISKAQAALDDLKEKKDGKPSEYDQIMQKYLKDGPIAMQQPSQ